MGRRGRTGNAHPMTTHHMTTSRPRRLIRSAAYTTALLPVALIDVAATACGRSERDVGSWQKLAGRPAIDADPAQPVILANPALILGHALLSILLGLTALIPFGVILAFLFRGVLYGLVDHGPYDNSWGGPTRTGAWLVHFLISAPAAAAAILLLAGLAAVHQRLNQPRFIALAILIPLPAAAFFVAWLHQI